MIQINPATINAVMKETHCLINGCKNPIHKHRLEIDLKSYLAIKDIFDSVEGKKRK